jgi:hypothetical protein
MDPCAEAGCAGCAGGARELGGECRGRGCRVGKGEDQCCVEGGRVWWSVRVRDGGWE